MMVTHATGEVINLTGHLARRALIEARAVLHKAELVVADLRERWYRQRDRDAAVAQRWEQAIAVLADARGVHDRAARELHVALERERRGG